MNWIISTSNKIKFHTYLDEILVPLKEHITNYKWILSDLDYGGGYGPDFPINMEQEYFIFSPDEFTTILNNHIQFYWGVIIGVPFTSKIILGEDNLPTAEFNPLISDQFFNFRISFK